MDSAAALVEQKISETLTDYAYPPAHWLKTGANNPMQRIMRDSKRRTRVISAFPDRDPALMLVAARLRYIASSQ